MAKADTQSLTPEDHALRAHLINIFYRVASQLSLTQVLGHNYYLHDCFRALESKGCRRFIDLTKFTAEDLDTTPDAVALIKSEMAAWGLKLKPSVEKTAEELALAAKLDKRHHARHDKF